MSLITTHPLASATFVTCTGTPIVARFVRRDYRPHFLFRLEVNAPAGHGMSRWLAPEPGAEVGPVGWQRWTGTAWVEIVGPVDPRPAAIRSSVRRAVQHSRSHGEGSCDLRELGQVQPDREGCVSDHEDQANSRLTAMKRDRLGVDTIHLQHRQVIAGDAGGHAEQPRSQTGGAVAIEQEASLLIRLASPRQNLALVDFNPGNRPGQHMANSHFDSPSLGPDSPPSVAEAGSLATPLIPSGGEGPGGGPAVAEPKGQQSHEGVAE